MTLAPDEIEHIAKGLASAYRYGGVSHEASLHRLRIISEAEDVQEATLRILAGVQVGYALSATSPTTARLLGCSGLVITPLLYGAMLDDGTRRTRVGGLPG